MSSNKNWRLPFVSLLYQFDPRKLSKSLRPPRCTYHLRFVRGIRRAQALVLVDLSWTKLRLNHTALERCMTLRNRRTIASHQKSLRNPICSRGSRTLSWIQPHYAHHNGVRIKENNGKSRTYLLMTRVLLALHLRPLVRLDTQGLTSEWVILTWLRRATQPYDTGTP